METLRTSIAAPTATPASHHQNKTDAKTNEDVLKIQPPAAYQPKLTVGAPDDVYEKEADAMADKVMRMPMPEPINFSSSKNTVNRKCTECKEEEKLQRKESNGDLTSVAPPIVHDIINSSPGKSLDTDTRAFMEPRFGYDFSNVKIHDNTIAAKSASSINALAYTSRNNVVFNSGQYDTNSDSGKRLLAHELTHVVQQQGNDSSDYLTKRIQRKDAEVASLDGLVAKRVAFNNTGGPSANNCANVLPAALGVDGPHTGANGMEMIFEIDGAIPPGTEFEITRTKATGTWERDAASVWTRIGGDPAGTNDDHHDDDECHIPVKKQIFVIDTPGMGSLNPRGAVFPNGDTISATATAAVRKHNFAEWVMARNRSLGIGWKVISSPTFHRWHSIVSVQLVGGTWTRVDTPSGQNNEIELGSISTTGRNP